MQKGTTIKYKEHKTIPYHTSSQHLASGYSLTEISIANFEFRNMVYAKKTTKFNKRRIKHSVLQIPSLPPPSPIPTLKI